MKPWKEKKERTKWTMAYVGELKKVFYLQGWDIFVDFYNNPSPDNSLVAAECTPDWRYRRATIKIFPQFWTQTEPERKDCLKHEFVHILLSPFMLMIDGLKKGRMVTEDELHSSHEHVTTWFEAIIPTP